jgi:hypothetical protein
LSGASPPDRVGACGPDTGVAPVPRPPSMTAIYDCRSARKLRCGGAVPRSLTAARPQQPSPYRATPLYSLSRRLGLVLKNTDCGGCCSLSPQFPYPKLASLLKTIRFLVDPNPYSRFPLPPSNQPSQGTRDPTSANTLWWCGLGPSVPVSVAPFRLEHARMCVGELLWVVMLRCYDCCSDP